MNPSLTLVPLEPKHLEKADAWFDDKKSRLLFKQPGTPSTTDYAGRPLAWAALEGDNAVGAAIITIDQQQMGWLNFAVEPAARRRGVGVSLVSLVLQEPSVRALRKLRVLADPANTGGQKVLEHNGFSRIGYSAEGEVEFERRDY
jgi:ribosomal protein S18 acetylase RimI-like enzyme